MLPLAAGCGASAHHGLTAAQSATQRTAKGCKMLAKWENGNATDTISNDPVSVLIVEAASGTRFAKDFDAWISVNATSMATAADAVVKANQVAADCR
jgi:succinyl-CoA synthetase alpha subunit